MASVTVTARITATSEQSTAQIIVFDTGGGVFAQGIAVVDTSGNPVAVATTGAPIVSNNALQVALSGMAADSTAPANIYGMPRFGLYNDSAANLTAGQLGVNRLSIARGQHVNLRNNAGTEISSLTVSPASNALGLIVRPMTATDGVNVQPTLDAVSRAGYFQLTNGLSLAMLDSSGFLKVNVAAGSGSAFSYLNIVTNINTTVKSGAGTLAAVSINTRGASGNTATLYDSLVASGMKIGTIDTTAGVGSIGYDVAFATGLIVSTATGTPGDLTVQWS